MKKRKAAALGTLERRFFKGAEIRSSEEGHISGHCAVFNEEYVLWDSAGYRAVEKIMPGAFTRPLKENHDVRCLFNHDPNQLLGRTAAGTMTLNQDNRGLYFDCTVPDTQLGRDVVTLVKRGDISGGSFAFIVTKETITEEKADGKIIRTRAIEDLDLFDASPVTYPAYTGTDVNARAIEMRGAMFPQGIPSSLAGLVPELREEEMSEEEMSAECSCGCRACMSGDCDECDMYMAECGDPDNCDHDGDESYSARSNDKPTKRVAGEDLTADCFLYVGDPEKTGTWALPWKFSTEAKTVSHLRNALARFNQTKKIPADKKPGVWKKLVRLCKKYDIKVSDDEAKALGLTAEQRAALRDDPVGTPANKCQCTCAECQASNCDNCSNEDCDEPGCDHTPDDDGDERARLEVDAYMNERQRIASI